MIQNSSMTDYKGYLYCLWNRMFTSYGEHVYKLGRTSCLQNRLNNYVTTYIEPSEYKYTTNRVFENSCHAERLLFFLLRRHRVKKNREFFNVSLDTIIETMKKIEAMSDEKITKLYNRILKDYCNENVMDNEEDDKHFLDCMVSLDEFFEKYRFRPKNPEMYYKFGYVEPEVNDWYVLNYRVIYDDNKESDDDNN